MSPVKVDGYIRGIRTLLQRCVCGRGGGGGGERGRGVDGILPVCCSGRGSLSAMVTSLKEKNLFFSLRSILICAGPGKRIGQTYPSA